MVVYLVLVAVVRLLGKRMSGQIANLELAVMVLLGAVVSGAFQMPDRGVLPALALMLTLLALQRGFSSAGARWSRFERLTQGGSKMLIQNGVLQLDEFRNIGISRERVFAELRGSGIRHLGEVKRLYLEVSGTFSIFREASPIPGLSVFPGWDRELAARCPPARGLSACAHCGLVARATDAAECGRCARRDFTQAVLAPAPAQPTASPSRKAGERGDTHAA